MNNYNSKGSLNLEPKLTTVLIWVVSLLSAAGISFSNGLSTAIVIVSTILILFYEKKDALIRNHAAQALTLNLVAIVTSILISSIFSVLVALVIWIPVLNFITTTLLTMVMNLISIGFFVINLYALLQAWEKKNLTLPLITPIANTIEQALGK